MKEPKKIDCYHVPVMLSECLDAMDLRPDGTYVDVTFGGGGHSKEILKHLSDEGHLFGFDQDADAEQNIPADDERFTFVRSNFRYLKNWMRYYDVDGVDALLADLGVSSHHFDAEERGFSFRFDAPLDMRMNGRGGMTAADVVNKYSEEQLKGEIVLIISGAPRKEAEEMTFEQAVAYANELVAKGETKTSAAKTAAKESGFKKGDIYKILTEEE